MPFDGKTENLSHDSNNTNSHGALCDANLIEMQIYLSDRVLDSNDRMVIKGMHNDKWFFVLWSFFSVLSALLTNEDVHIDDLISRLAANRTKCALSA